MPGTNDHTSVPLHAWPMLTGGVLLVLAATFYATRPVDFVVHRPGPAADVLAKDGEGRPMIEVPAQYRKDADGDLRLTTITRMGGPGLTLTRADLWEAEIDPHTAIWTVEELYPDRPSGEAVQEASKRQMLGSQESAVIVAERAAGLDVNDGNQVAAVAQGAPADGVLAEGDRITKVNGTAVSTLEQVNRAMDRVRPGQQVTLQVLRDDKPTTLAVGTKDRDGRAVMGVSLEARFKAPVPVKFHLGSIGGPSAGMIFSLGLYDVLTPGELTGGKHIAGTGEMSTSGEVGPIGGIALKMVGARSRGADYFLAPRANCDEVVGHIPDGLQVFSVGTFDEALKTVKQIASGSTAGLHGCG